MGERVEREAFVTLATNDTYAIGCLVLGNSLRRVQTTRRLVIMVTPGVSYSMRNQLGRVFDVINDVNILDSQDSANLQLLGRPDLSVTFTKLHCWRLTQFDKCVFMDADTMVLQNVDELFDREELSAAPDAGWPDCFNSGVFVFVPSEETYLTLLQFAMTQGSFDGGDQGLLNQFFHDWAHKDISKHLPFIYNVVSQAFYSYLPAFTQFKDTIKIVHFIGEVKPWHHAFNSATGQVMPLPGTGHSQEFLQMWWNLFLESVQPTLDPALGGLIGALAGMDLSGKSGSGYVILDDRERKLAWERGQMDYLGVDKFENIQKKLDQKIIDKRSPSPTSTSKAVEEETSAEEKTSSEVPEKAPPAPKSLGTFSEELVEEAVSEASVVLLAESALSKGQEPLAESPTFESEPAHPDTTFSETASEPVVMESASEPEVEETLSFSLALDTASEPSATEHKPDPVIESTPDPVIESTLELPKEKTSEFIAVSLPEPVVEESFTLPVTETPFEPVLKEPSPEPEVPKTPTKPVVPEPTPKPTTKPPAPVSKPSYSFAPKPEVETPAPKPAVPTPAPKPSAPAPAPKPFGGISKSFGTSFTPKPSAPEPAPKPAAPAPASRSFGTSFAPKPSAPAPAPKPTAPAPASRSFGTSFAPKTSAPEPAFKPAAPAPASRSFGTSFAPKPSVPATAPEPAPKPSAPAPKPSAPASAAGIYAPKPWSATSKPVGSVVAPGAKPEAPAPASKPWAPTPATKPTAPAPAPKPASKFAVKFPPPKK